MDTTPLSYTEQDAEAIHSMATNHFYVTDDQVREVQKVIASGDIDVICAYYEPVAQRIIQGPEYADFEIEMMVLDGILSSDLIDAFNERCAYLYKEAWEAAAKRAAD